MVHVAVLAVVVVVVGGGEGEGEGGVLAAGTFDAPLNCSPDDVISASSTAALLAPFGCTPHPHHHRHNPHSVSLQPL